MNRTLLAFLILLICGQAISQYSKEIKIEQVLKTDTTSMGQKLSYPQFGNSEVTMLKVTIPPGKSTGWHKHTVPAFAYILEGTITVEFENHKKLVFNKNSTVAEAMNIYHNGINEGDSDVVMIAVYLGEKGKPLSVRQEEPEVKKDILKLWYTEQANEWMQALPVGNGRLGAMVFGGIEDDRLALNEITLWAGQPDPNQEPACGKEKLAEIRKLFFDGKLKEGNEMAVKYLSGKPNTYGTHLPAGDLILHFRHPSQEISSYERELDIEHAVASVAYQSGAVKYEREIFCSNPDNILVYRITSDKKKSITLTAKVQVPGTKKMNISSSRITFSGTAVSGLKVNGFPEFSKGGVEFTGIVNAIAKGGKTEALDSALSITDADEVLLLVDIRTSLKDRNFSDLCRQDVEGAATKNYELLKDRHTDDFSDLFDRLTIWLGTDRKDTIPTDRRFRNYNNGKDDPGLCALFLQYNRYLLLSCSRENSPLPANLQGLWNDNLACNMPWTCDYHLDINTQQNYWAANVTGLPECIAPLTGYIEYLSKAGSSTAEKVYGCKGWVAHTVTNVWGYTAPGEWPGWGLFPTAGTWLALQLWDHYRFTGDTAFLKNRAYPLLKGSAEFFLDYMVPDPASGFLMTGPSTSPENAFRYKKDILSLSMMPTCDRVLVAELFNACISATAVTGDDKEFRDKLISASGKLPPFRISRNGEIQEWFTDYEKAQPNHRHTSHLTALYPFAQITPVKTPDLAKAAGKTISNRLQAPGWEDVEWSRANMINFYARLREPEQALQSLNILLKNLTRENLLTISVAGIAGAQRDIFILDGNEAAAAGIAEMLVQSHEDYIEFLPALPKAWDCGQYNGLCVRGGGVAAVKWEKMKPVEASLVAKTRNHYRIKLPEQMKVSVTLNDTKIPYPVIINNILEAEMNAGDRLGLKYH